ncbi:MAG: ABC transporter permease, partial [bacterium]
MQSQTATLTRLRYSLANFPEVVALISFLLIFIFFAVSAEHFLTLVALSNILSFASILGIIVVGVAMLMIAGEFDLSVGSNFAVASFVFALTMGAGIAPLLAMLLAVLISALLGALNGVIV